MFTAELSGTPADLEALIQRLAPHVPLLKELKRLNAEPGGPLVFNPELMDGSKLRASWTTKPDG